MDLAFAWLLESVKNSKTAVTALLAIPTKANLSGLISKVIGDRVARELASGKAVPMQHSLSDIRLITQRTKLTSWRGGPVLAAYPTKQLLDMLDDMYGITEILVVPWRLAEIQSWVDTWGPQKLGSSVPAPQAIYIENPIVVEALKSLTDTVNLSTGILHPRDRQAAIDLFQRLRQAGKQFNPSEVRAWLVSQGGWSPQDADQVKSIAESVLAGKRLRGGGRFWADDIVEQRRVRATKH
ncbi:MAG: hypothetical protein V3U95_02700 [Dehalococcoidia bacterium]